MSYETTVYVGFGIILTYDDIAKIAEVLYPSANEDEMEEIIDDYTSLVSQSMKDLKFKLSLHHCGHCVNGEYSCAVGISLGSLEGTGIVYLENQPSNNVIFEAADGLAEYVKKYGLTDRKAKYFVGVDLA